MKTDSSSPSLLHSVLCDRSKASVSVQYFSREEAVSKHELQRVTRSLRIPFGIVYDGDNRPIGVELTARSLSALGINQERYYLMDESAPCHYAQIGSSEAHSSNEHIYTRINGSFFPVRLERKSRERLAGQLFRKTRVPLNTSGN